MKKRERITARGVEASTLSVDERVRLLREIRYTHGLMRALPDIIVTLLKSGKYSEQIEGLNAFGRWENKWCLDHRGGAPRIVQATPAEPQPTAPPAPGVAIDEMMRMGLDQPTHIGKQDRRRARPGNRTRSSR